MWELVPLWISHVWHQFVWWFCHASYHNCSRYARQTTSAGACCMVKSVSGISSSMLASDHICMFSRHTALVILVSFTQHYHTALPFKHPTCPLPLQVWWQRTLLFSSTCIILHRDLFLVLWLIHSFTIQFLVNRFSMFRLYGWFLNLWSMYPCSYCFWLKWEWATWRRDTLTCPWYTIL